MNSEFSIKKIAMTSETGTDTLTNNNSDEKLFTFGGKMAGVCYMPDDYFDSKIQDEEKATKRAEGNVRSGHHSVFDHGSITFQISNLPKIMAMILNSVEQYTTSEKSSRYTIMHPETEEELKLYDKWTEKFGNLISDRYGSKIDDKMTKKLAIENARYLISVWVPTSMTWTTTYRQCAYVISWLDKLAKDCVKIPNAFNLKLEHWCNIMADGLRSQTSCYKHIYDIKNRKIEFLTMQSYGAHITENEFIGDVYQRVYTASFAQVAQLQRHRTLHYEIEFSGTPGEHGIYIPKIITDDNLIKEFTSDYNSIAYCIPQATLVKVLEQGRAIKFFDKAKERLCGRAQLEIMENTAQTMQIFLDNKDKLSKKTLMALDEVTSNNTVITKCMMRNITCTEGCIWGSVEGLYRQI